MNARTIALISTFAAIAIALNTIRIPTIYWLSFSYYFHEIPIVVAFLLFGFKIGISVELIHLAGQLVLFPAGPAGFVVYPMGFVVVLVMFLGIYVARRLTSPKDELKKAPRRRPIFLLTGFAVVFRAGIMPLIDYVLLYHYLLPLVLGISFSEAYIVALVPSSVLFNVTVPLYTIPIAYVVARRVSKYLETERQV